MFEPGTLLQNRYELMRQIGQGGFGAVYEARDQRLHTMVAIKHLMLLGEQSSRAFEQEALLLASLRHPALPRVIDHFVDESGQFLVMDYVAGQDLAELLRLNRGAALAVPQVLRWADTLLDALAYLHRQARPVVHRDIKPSNIKLTDDGNVVLLDFGLAKGTTGNLNSVLSLHGYTPQYAPLEQIQGAGTESRSDLYALAATIYHLLTGQQPADALTRASAVLQNAPDPLVPPQTLNPLVPEHVGAALLQALALNLSQRPATATALRELLRADPLVSSGEDVRTIMPEARPTLVRVATPRSSAASTALPPADPARPDMPASTSLDGPRRRWLVAGFGMIGALLLVFLLLNRPDDQRLMATLPPPSQVLSGADGSNLPLGQRPPVAIAASLPLSGDYAEEALAIDEGIRMRLDEAGNTACSASLPINYTLLDSSVGNDVQQTELANAQLAIQQQGLVAYIGPLSPDALQATLPLLNQAGLVMIAPDAAQVELTQSVDGVDPGSLYPTGERTLLRLLAPDNIQAERAAQWLSETGRTRVVLISDGSDIAAILAPAFEQRAAATGLELVDSINDFGTDTGTSIDDTVAIISDSEADAIYYAGYSNPSLAPVLNLARVSSPELTLIGSSKLLDSWIDNLESSKNVFITIPGVDWKGLGAAGETWAQHYSDRYGHEPGVFAAYGYEAAGVVLDALNRSCKAPNRSAILHAVMQTRDYQGLLGTWSVQPSGDISLDTVTLLRIDAGSYAVETLIAPPQ